MSVIPTEWILGLVVFLCTSSLCYLALRERQQRAWTRSSAFLRQSLSLEPVAKPIGAPWYEQLTGRWGDANRLHREIELNLANVLDLMRVCIDAGLDLYSTMARVSQEFETTSPKLARLFRNVQLQLKAGASREQAFEGFAEASGSPEVRNLMVSLAEAEQFGAGVATILKTYSSELRTRRRLKAEELGAKLSTKLLFPLLLCLFPAMMVVLAGPSILAAIEIVRGMQ
ncbi:MAG: type II secretion system F family protein [Gammaproteobacteria bacterium]|jgi:Flp pilus assembly protein TadB|nr:type II secretion system F family protein [Gammaproteobacteria bacterium]